MVLVAEVGVWGAGLHAGASFPALDVARASIMGHSMGGHGALTIGLKNAGMPHSLRSLVWVVSKRADWLPPVQACTGPSRRFHPW